MAIPDWVRIRIDQRYTLENPTDDQRLEILERDVYRYHSRYGTVDRPLKYGDDWAAAEGRRQDQGMSSRGYVEFLEDFVARLERLNQGNRIELENALRETTRMLDSSAMRIFTMGENGGFGHAPTVQARLDANRELLK